LRVKDAIGFIIDSTEQIYNRRESESIAFLILEFIGYSRKDVLFRPDTETGTVKEEFICKAVDELKTSKPIQYILGETEFCGLKFRLNESVLIPRQETEELVQRIVRDNEKPGPVILDLGTGSGCIAVSLSKKIPLARVYATDISKQALQIAENNAELNNVKIITLCEDMLNPQRSMVQKFNIIVSNPPYVLNSEKTKMHANVLNFEPEIALYVRDDNPLEYYKAISVIARESLLSGGKLYVEINETLAYEVLELFRRKGFVNMEIIPDIHEKNRFVKAVMP
jgi:release factor glutamine methyltransferase